MTVARKGFVIERLPEGGFVVAPITNGGIQAPSFAALDIDDALDFLWNGLQPEEPAEEAQGTQAEYVHEGFAR